MVVSLGPGKFYGSSLPRPYIYTDVKLNSERVDPPMSVMDPFLSWANEAHWSMGGLNFNRLRLQGRIEGNIVKLRSEHEKRIKIEIIDSPSASPSPPPPAPAAKRRRVFRLNDEDEEPEVVVKKVVPVEKSNGLRVSAAKKVIPVEKNNGVSVFVAKKAVPVKKNNGVVVSGAKKVVPVEKNNRVGVSGVKRDVQVEKSNGVVASGIETRSRRKLARNLGDEFDSVASESGMIVEKESPNGSLVKNGEKSIEKLKSKKVRRKLVKASEIRTSPRLRTSTRLS